MRYAIYYTPDRNDPLTRAAAGWLGRDPFGGPVAASSAVAGMQRSEIAFHTAAARRYGFHATLKAPFRLAADRTEADLVDALAAFARRTPAVTMPRLAIGQIDGFFALLPTGNFDAIKEFAGTVVRDFEPFRAPLTEAEIERRSPDALSAEEFRNLCQWGYPYVFDAFRFHMTLTGRVGAIEAPRMRAALEYVFSPLLEAPVALDGLALFVEPEAGGPFTGLSRHVLSSERERKSA